MKTTAPSPARRLIAAAATLALTLAGVTATAMPARADNNDLAKALAAIAALAIIAKTIDDNNDRGRYNGGGNGHGYQPKPVPVPVPRPEPIRRVLPGVCAIELVDRGRREVWYSRPCLREQGVGADLPRRCAAEVRLRGRDVTVYRERCMIDAGFRVGRGGWGGNEKHENPRKW